MSFLSRLPADEMCHLTHLMLRGVLPQADLLTSATALGATVSTHTTTLMTSHEKEVETDSIRPSTSSLFLTLTEKSEKWYSAVTAIAQSVPVNVRTRFASPKGRKIFP